MLAVKCRFKQICFQNVHKSHDENLTVGARMVDCCILGVG